jgi:hypothetical protein
MNNYRQYEVWHDESKKGAYFHGFLLIPLDKKQKIIQILKQIRHEHGYGDSANVKFAGCLKKNKNGIFVRNSLNLFQHIIQSKVKNKSKIFNRSGKDLFEKNFDSYLIVNDIFQCKFGLLKIKKLEETLNYFNNYRRKVETSFRFLAKSCLHGMFNEKNPIEITKLYFDGEEQYKGNLDLERITRGHWRNYCRLSENICIDARIMENRDDETKIIMNFVDNIVGAWRALLNKETDSNKVLLPLKGLNTRLKNKKIFANKNSRWYKSISLSEFEIINGKIKFPNIFGNKNQLKIF